MHATRNLDSSPTADAQECAAMPHDVAALRVGRAISLINELEQIPMNSYTGTELEKLASKFDHPVVVDGRNMNVNIQGNGDRTVVLLQGRGTTAPALDFQPLTDDLTKRGFRVVVPEFFGSGLSDMTDKPRTPEQIVAEVHEALQHLGIDKYDLVGHSLAGTKALEFAKQYPDEVLSFTGIDTATPGMSKFVTAELEAASPTPSAPLPSYDYTPNEREIMAALEERNEPNDGEFSRINKAASSKETAKKPTMFPKGMPVHFFLSQDSVAIADANSPEPWYVREHLKQVPGSIDSVVTVLPGEHYLHQNQPAAIAAGIDRLRD